MEGFLWSYLVFFGVGLVRCMEMDVWIENLDLFWCFGPEICSFSMDQVRTSVSST